MKNRFPDAPERPAAANVGRLLRAGPFREAAGLAFELRLLQDGPEGFAVRCDPLFAALWVDLLVRAASTFLGPLDGEVCFPFPFF